MSLFQSIRKNLDVNLSLYQGFSLIFFSLFFKSLVQTLSTLEPNIKSCLDYHKDVL